MSRNILEVIHGISEDKTFTPSQNLTQIGRVAKGFAPMLTHQAECWRTKPSDRANQSCEANAWSVPTAPLVLPHRRELSSIASEYAAFHRILLGSQGSHSSHTLSTRSNNVSHVLSTVDGSNESFAIDMNFTSGEGYTAK